ncbi:hypothetical protein IQE94_15250 [Synechocystis sp. PCC 7339]|uniref:hypothetical protein n=1 Tax=unclassified Synechocystis TaxID=2640012 RepID=UPI001BAFA70F|nr:MULTISPECIES: hypothetical protein [unclassified Synechocystis]QUS60145.1 hypothetical protein HTZ78_05310 [Synechocystis sp. PCC 7338]UAJ72408.1 hypothetical protein IQE94_15250 [Synechocystis sp. PCC 7339]
MEREVYRRIVALVAKAAELAKTVGINNLLQPGLVKEMIIADLLGNELITTKRDADARNPNDPSIVYEYLSCKEGGTGQLDRMFKEPDEKRQESLNRIWRNSKIYYAVFYENNQIKPKVIYELEPKVLVEETERQLDRSRNAISHVSFSESWVRKNGKVVYEDTDN